MTRNVQRYKDEKDSFTTHTYLMAVKGHQQLVRAYLWDSGYLPGPAVTCAFYWDLPPAKASGPWSGSSSVDPAAVADSDLDC